MSQTELAEALDISAAHVGHIERGTRHASLETVVAISQRLEVSLDELIFPANIAQVKHYANLNELRTLIASAHDLIDELTLSAAD